MTITYGSVCSGIEAATVAWHPLGMKADWLAEIEPFPSAVLDHHYPNTPNHGDMTKLAALVLARKIQAPDVLVGGTPCQAFSVAGMREGLSDPRGALTIKYVELADAIDYVRALDRKPPAVNVWENVPGVLSDKGNAFGCFLGALAGEDSELHPSGKRWPDAGCVYGPKRTIAWRVLDAQYFGLAQRRRRVFVVASARDGFDPAQVLFEREGVRRDTAPRRDEGEDVAGTIASRTGAGGFPGTDEACSGYLQGVDLRNGSITGDVTHTVQAGHHAPDPGGTPHVIAIHGTQDPDVRINQAHTLGRNSGQENAIFCREVAQTITSNYGKQLDNTNSALGPNIVAAFAENSRAELRYEGGDGAITGSLSGGGGKAGQGMPAAQVGSAVRRLTPKECERLQGFPDDYTLIPWRNKPAGECPDGPRYKAIGNSKAVPVVRWIGKRLLAALQMEH